MYIGRDQKGAASIFKTDIELGSETLAPYRSEYQDSHCE